MDIPKWQASNIFILQVSVCFVTVSQTVTVKVHHVDEQSIKRPNLASALETNCILYNVLQMCNNPYSGGDKNTSCENKCTLMEENDKE